MKKIRNAVLKLAAFFVFYYTIGISAFLIQWIGYFFNLDRVFGVLFDPLSQKKWTQVQRRFLQLVI